MIWIQEICGLLPLTRNTINMIATKNAWTNRQEISLDHRQDLHLKYLLFYQVVVFLKASCSAV